MDHHPYRYKGRFYNHQHDSIAARFWRMLKTSYEMRHHLKACGGKKMLLAEAESLSPVWLVRDVAPVPSSDHLVVTWLGHATVLIQVGGFNILFDPVFGEISRIVPRMMKFPWAISDIPMLDAILLSHNHRDHADVPSLKKLLSHQPTVYVPQGDARLVRRLGYDRVTEMTWWQEAVVTKNGTPLTISFLPASHWTGRSPFDLNASLWGSWMISYQGRNIYFAGDTAYDQHFAAIRQRYGEIDVAIVPVGPVEPHGLIADAHLDPHEAVEAFVDLGAKIFIPMHWGTFMFGTDRFLDPVHKLQRAWNERGEILDDKKLHVVKCGQSYGFASASAASAYEKGEQISCL
ncbi:MAG: MBL fold metallo-hydrolase [Candidatus Babeliales bacterium]|jgi:L-ascorbate metabolism protein UlaG (beta-lactamase superfamily)